MLMRLQWTIVFSTAILIICSLLATYVPGKRQGKRLPPRYWTAPDTLMIPHNERGMAIRYGRDLIANTAYYLGPSGKLAAISNGMNCQNCHLQAGTKFFGNNFSAVTATYPRWSARAGRVISVADRINDCMQRSLCGEKLDTNSREMRAMEAYMEWLGTATARGERPVGTGIESLPFPKRAADSLHGAAIFLRKCSLCHGNDGQGQQNDTSAGYQYPPLWGPNSFSAQAGLFRVSNLAGFIRNNMPFGTEHGAEKVTVEECWDLAAFISSQSRPQRIFQNDWPNISEKPFDYPTGPYADSFGEKMHKYGPFPPIIAWYKIRGQQ